MSTLILHAFPIGASYFDGFDAGRAGHGAKGKAEVIRITSARHREGKKAYRFLHHLVEKEFDGRQLIDAMQQFAQACRLRRQRTQAY